MKKKESVLEFVAKDEKDIVILFALKDVGAEERPGFIEKMFAGAVKTFKDEPASKVFLWLMQSISDLEPDEAKAFSQRAEKAIVLYRGLPSHEMQDIRIQVAQDESKPGKDEFPTLMKTREIILTEIASQCFRMKSEEESKILLYFLLDLPTKFKEERELIRKVIQNTDSTADTDHLERCFEWAMNKPRDLKMGRFFAVWDDVEEIAHVLAKGWMRDIRHVGWGRNGLKELLHRMKIFRPLINSSDGAKEFLERISGEIAKTDRKVQCLVNRLKNPPSGKIFSDVPGDIEVTYDEEGFNINNVTVTVIPPDALPHIKKAQIFGLAADLVRKWKNEEGNATLRIRLMGKEGKFISEIGTY